MKLLIAILIVLCTVHLAYADKFIQYQVSSGRVSSNVLNEIGPDIPGVAYLTVADNFEFPVPPAGQGWTSCSTGSQFFSRVIDGQVVLRNNLTVFYCRQVNNRKDVFNAAREASTELFDEDDQQFVQIVLKIFSKCPTNQTNASCPAARDVMQVLQNSAINDFKNEVKALLDAKGWN